MAIFQKTIISALALDHQFDREPMALNFSLESELSLSQASGRTHEKEIDDTLFLSQTMHRTHAETLGSTLALSDAASGINAGRVLSHELSLESSVVRSPSDFGRPLESELSLQQHVAVIKLPLIENGRYS